MPKLNKYNKKVNLSDSLIIRSEPIERLEEYFLYDVKNPGLYVRIAHASKGFYLYYINALNKQKRIKLGRFPKMQVKDARSIAEEIIKASKNGEDYLSQRRKTLIKLEKTQAKQTKSVEQVFEIYYELYSKVYKKKYEDDIRVFNKDVRHIIGKISIRDLDVEALNKVHTSKKGTPFVANRIRALLSHFLNWCEQYNYRDMNTNPIRFIKQYKEEGRERFLNQTELFKLGKAFDKFENSDRFDTRAIYVIKMLLYTGCRVSEIRNLQWSEINLENSVINLKASKTGKKSVPLTNKAKDIILIMKKKNKAKKGFVFVNPKTGEPYKGLRRPWMAILKEAGITESTHLHDLRHTFASIGAANNKTPDELKTILGHSSISTTQIYTHIEDRKAREAANDIANSIDGYLNGNKVFVGAVV